MTQQVDWREFVELGDPEINNLHRSQTNVDVQLVYVQYQGKNLKTDDFRTFLMVITASTVQLNQCPQITLGL